MQCDRASVTVTVPVKLDRPVTLQLAVAEFPDVQPAHE